MFGANGAVVPLRGGDVNVEPLRLLSLLSFVMYSSLSTSVNIFDFCETELIVLGFVFVGSENRSEYPSF